jgi:hypothetical protein
VERESPLGGVARQARGKGFGKDFQSVVRVPKRIQNPPRQQRQNVIAQVVGCAKPDSTTNWRQLGGHLPTVTLGRCHRHFRGELVASRGESR